MKSEKEKYQETLIFDFRGIIAMQRAELMNVTFQVIRSAMNLLMTNHHRFRGAVPSHVVDKLLDSMSDFVKTYEDYAADKLRENS